MATVEHPRSMNEANERDPYNNNCYGTLVDRAYKEVKLPILDVHDFNERIIRGYEEGDGEKDLPADLAVARSLVPAGTAALRDFSYIAPEIPEYIREQLHRLHGLRHGVPRHGDPGQGDRRERISRTKLAAIPDPADREMFAGQWSKTRKYYEGPEKKGREGGHVRDHHRPQQVQGLRGVRHRLRRQRPEDDSQDRAGDDRDPQEPSAVQAGRPVATSGTSTTTCSST